MAKQRTFLAFETTAETKQRANELIRKLSETTTSVRWVNADNLHVTMKFLGDVEDRDLYAIYKAADHAVRDIPHFAIPCRGVGAFPSLERPRTLWLGLDDSEERLANLFSRLDDQLAQIGYPPEPRKFHPHITIGRIRHGRRNLGDLPNVIEQLQDYEAGWLAVDELTIFTSQLTREGPVYTVVGRAELGDG